MHSADRDESGDDQCIRAGLVGIEELCETDRAAGTALVFVLDAFGQARRLEGRAEATPGLVKTTTGSGWDHDAHGIEGRSLREAQRWERGGGNRQGQRLQDRTSVHAGTLVNALVFELSITSGPLDSRN